MTPRCSDDWFASVATPAGRGAIAVIEVHADPALCDHPHGPLFRGKRRAGDLAVGDVIYGEWGPAPAEDVVLVRRGESRFEIQCHGGRAAIARVCETLEGAGVELVPWSEAIRKSRGGIMAETAQALSRCACSSALPHLLAQYNGAFEEEVLALRPLLDRDMGAVVQRLDRLVERAEFALHLTEPWRVVIAGRPNAGKSSLLNALAGRERAIVSPLPGTTRDVVSVDLSLGGWPVRLLDTAGLRDTADPLERMGVGAALTAAAEADLVLLVRDATESDPEEILIEAFPRRCQRVANKSDAPCARGRPGEWMVSALTGSGLDELTRRVVGALVPEEPPMGEALVVTPALAEMARDWLRLARDNDRTRLAMSFDAAIAAPNPRRP